MISACYNTISKQRDSKSGRLHGYRSGLAVLLLAAAFFLAGCQPADRSPGGSASAGATARPATAAPPSVTATSFPPAPTATVAPSPALTAVVTGTMAPVAVATSVPPATAVTGTVAATSTIPVYTYKVVATYPHDPTAFTEGLVYEDDGVLYEGTGLKGQSVLEKKELETGRILQRIDLPAQFFGEGVAVFGDKIYQLTWQEFTGFVYDKESFQPLATFSYPTEGWGLAHDGRRLIMSDGTANLYFLDPETLQRVGQVEVRDDRGPVTQINELEYVDGEVYANIWQTDRIARIDPETGQVVGWIDLTGLLPAEDRQQRVDVLNGIGYDSARDRLFVTGKWWPKLFEIDLVPVGQAQ